MGRLHRTDPTQRGIRRRRRGRGFTYSDHRARPIRDPKTLTRIRSLAIPPAWSDVWICASPDGHLQAVGTDAAGRRQYRYHERWDTRRAQRKFARVIAVARALPALRQRVAEDLAGDDVGRDRVLACAVRLLDRGFFRIGSESYAQRNGSFGLATLRSDHVHRRGKDVVVFDFAGKGGKRHVVEVVDPAIRAVVDRLKDRRGGGDELLAFRDERDRWRDVRSNDINDYLKRVAGVDVTAKDFRTWHATVLAGVCLARSEERPRSKRARDSAVREAVREVSGFLGNTPAVCRTSYIDPRVIDRYLDGWTIGPALRGERDLDPADAAMQARIEEAVLDLIEERDSPAIEQTEESRAAA
jgi:DNA topoisomerase I